MIVTVLYVAASASTAREGAAELERAGSSLAVESAVENERIRTYAPGVDCVVFAETPTNRAGAHVLDVIDACGETPLVLYTDGEFDPEIALSTEGVDGYVRRDGTDSVVHLADQVIWTAAKVGDESDAESIGSPLVELTAAVDSVTDEKRLFDLATDTLESIPFLEFDAGGFFVVNGIPAIDRTPGVDDAHPPGTTFDQAAAFGTEIADDIAISRNDALVEATLRSGPIRVSDASGDDYRFAFDKPVGDRTGAGGGTASGTESGAESESGTESGAESESGTESETEAELRSGSAPPTADETSIKYRSGLCVPLGSFGVLQIAAKRPDAYDDAALEVATLVGATVADAMTRIRLESRLTRDRDRFAALRAGIARIAAADDEVAIYDTAAEVATETLDVESPTVRLLDDVWQTSGWEYRPDSAVDADDTSHNNVDGRVDADDTSHNNVEGRVDADDTSHNNVEGYRSVGRDAFTFRVPLGSFGVLEITSETPVAIDEVDRSIATALGLQVATAITRSRLRALVATRSERYDTLFDSLPDPAVRYELTDGRPVVRGVNAAFEDVFGLDPESILGAPLDEVVLPPSSKDALEQARERTDAIATGTEYRGRGPRKTATGITDVRIRAIPFATDGTAEVADSNSAGTADVGNSDIRDALAESTRTADPTEALPESGRKQHTHRERPEDGVVIYTDVTDLLTLERSISDRTDRLRTIESTVENELRGPLNVARGYLEVAETTGDEEHFAEVDAAHETLSERLESVLAVARGVGAIDTAELVSIHDVVKRAWSSVETGDASIELGPDRIVPADENRLLDLFSSYIETAIERANVTGPEMESGTSVESGAGLEPGSESGHDSIDGGYETPDSVTIEVGAGADGFYIGATVDVFSVTERRELLDTKNSRPIESTDSFDGASTIRSIIDAHDWSVTIDDDGRWTRLVVYDVPTEAVSSGTTRRTRVDRHAGLESISPEQVIPAKESTATDSADEPPYEADDGPPSRSHQ